MRCPACPDVTLAASARDGVTIHHCPRCRGVWLDRPDLDSVIARVVGSARPHASQQERFGDGPERDERFARRMASPRHDRDDDGTRARDLDWEQARRQRRKTYLEELFGLS